MPLPKDKQTICAIMTQHKFLRIIQYKSRIMPLLKPFGSKNKKPAGKKAAPKKGGAASHAKDLMGLVTKLNLQRPILLGHSMGAMTTLAFAGAYPDVPRAILLEDPPPWWVMNTASAEAAARRTELQA